MHMSRPLTAAIDTVRTAWLAPTRVHPRRVARLVTAPAAAADTTGSDAEYFTQSFKRLLQTMQSAGVVPASPSLEDTADETVRRGGCFAGFALTTDWLVFFAFCN